MSENTIIAAEQQQMPVLSVPKNTAVNVWQDKDAFDQAARVANMLSKSRIVPENYQNRPEDCFIAVELAARMNTSPVFIMQNLYVVKGKPSWAGQACMAMITACGKFKNVRHIYTGTKGTDTRGCYVEAVRVADGEIVQGTEVTLAMARSEGWMSNSKWKNMPEQMLGYRAASFFARMYCPEAMMGLHTAEEVYDAEVTELPATQNLENAIMAEEAAAEPEAKKPETKSRKTGSKAAEKAEAKAEPKAAEKPAILCTDCGKEIRGAKNFTAEKIAAMGVEKYGRQLCVECAAKVKKQMEEEAARQAEMEAQAAAEPSEVIDDSDLAAQLMAEAEG